MRPHLLERKVLSNRHPQSMLSIIHFGEIQSAEKWEMSFILNLLSLNRLYTQSIKTVKLSLIKPRASRPHSWTPNITKHQPVKWRTQEVSESIKRGKHEDMWWNNKHIMEKKWRKSQEIFREQLGDIWFLQEVYVAPESPGSGGQEKYQQLEHLGLKRGNNTQLHLSLQEVSLFVSVLIGPQSAAPLLCVSEVKGQQVFFSPTSRVLTSHSFLAATSSCPSGAVSFSAQSLQTQIRTLNKWLSLMCLKWK